MSGTEDVNDLFFFAQLFTQSADFSLQLPNAQLFLVVAIDLLQLHRCGLQPVAQGVNINAEIQGYFVRLPPMLSYHAYCAGFKCLVISRQRYPFLCSLPWFGPCPFHFTTDFFVRQFGYGGNFEKKLLQ